MDVFLVQYRTIDRDGKPCRSWHQASDKFSFSLSNSELDLEMAKRQWAMFVKTTGCCDREFRIVKFHLPFEVVKVVRADTGPML